MAISEKNKIAVNLYKLKFKLKNQDQILTCLLKVVKKFQPELKEEADKIRSQYNLEGGKN